LVSVQSRGDIIEKPISVTIVGEVLKPGPYIIDGKNDRLSAIIQRAGGLTPAGFIDGTQFARNPQFLTTAVQREFSPRLID
ncbi:hypothetical protein, partial [Aeromonas hydrophila]|uniref:hypothetical protein n=1 Tax=Aeromonas hydrophila TaxID=644 RepID=UPI00235E549B